MGAPTVSSMLSHSHCIAFFLVLRMQLGSRVIRLPSLLLSFLPFEVNLFYHTRIPRLMVGHSRPQNSRIAVGTSHFTVRPMPQNLCVLPSDGLTFLSSLFLPRTLFNILRE
eukprot:gene5486-3960_t